MKKSVFLFLFLISIIHFSCKRDESPLSAKKGIEDLKIPNGFNFSTSIAVDLQVSDNIQGVKYDVYSLETTGAPVLEYGDDTTAVLDDLNQKIASGFITAGNWHSKLPVPAYHRYLYLVRGYQGVFSSFVVPIVNGKAEFNYAEQKRVVAENDVLYSVSNSNSNIYRVDVVTGQVDLFGQLPYTSIACAVDRVNRRLYASKNSSPFTLGYYDLDNGNFVTTGTMHGSFPRMEYNHLDGLLYISDDNGKLYKVDPSNGQYLQTLNINGLAQKGWGDQAFGSDGNLYLVTQSGVYRADITGSAVQATKINQGNLPSNLTSMGADRAGNLYMSLSPSNGKIVKLKISDGSWEYMNVSLSYPVNDFGSWFPVENASNDADQDGVPDDEDDYPDDATKAFNNYYPGEGATATLAYEDLWPTKGDYDFNDLVLNYSVNQITNAENKVVSIEFEGTVRHIGASFNNGFAIELGVASDLVSTVIGNNITSSYVGINGNGTESGQTLANIVVFDEATPNLLQPLHVVINFSEGVETTVLGVPPYNPYLIKDGQLDYEVHLPDMLPTSLADQSVFGQGDDDTQVSGGKYYKTALNLPWGINIVYDYVWPLESREIVLGYLKFAAWAESGGQEFPDWYKDKAGYRDNAYLDVQQ